MTDLVKLPEQANATETTPRSREYGLGVLKGVLGAVPYVGTLLNE